MEFIDGRELKSYFDANERFPMAAVVRIMGELLDALEYSHGHGVVHRDIKPANIILLADGSVKVADFGIARIESSTLTQAGTVLGSPSYMSPEQFTGQTVDGRSDLYSAAVVLYQLLTGEVPFTGSFQNLMHRVLNEEASPPSVLNVQVPRAFDAVLQRAMAKRPDERYQSAAEFKQAIVAASSATVVAAAGVDRDPHASQATLVEPPGGTGERSARSRAWHLGLPLAALCLAGIAVAAYFWIEPHPTKKTTVAAAGKPSSAAVPTALETTARANPVPPPAEALPPGRDDHHQRRWTRRSQRSAICERDRCGRTPVGRCASSIDRQGSRPVCRARLLQCQLRGVAQQAAGAQ